MTPLVNVTAPSFEHVLRLTDERGMFEHADGTTRAGTRLLPRRRGACARGRVPTASHNVHTGPAGWPRTCRLSGGPRRPTVDATTGSIAMGSGRTGPTPGTGGDGRCGVSARPWPGAHAQSGPRPLRGFDLGMCCAVHFCTRWRLPRSAPRRFSAVRPRHDGALRLLSDFAAQAGRVRTDSAWPWPMPD